MSFFLRLDNIPLYGYATSCLPIHLLMDTGYFDLLTIVNNAAMNMGVYKYLYHVQIFSPILSVVFSYCIAFESHP